MFNLLIEYGEIILRTILSYLVLLLLTRLIGKQQISQLTFFDYVTGITIGSMAATISIDNTVQFTHGLIGLIFLSILSFITSKLSLKNTKLKNVIDGSPAVLIQNGVIIYENLKKERFSVVDLLEELRLNGTFNLNDVKFAVLERSGKVSIKLNSPNESNSNSDFSTLYNELTANLIIDGEIMHEHLKINKLSKTWLDNEIKTNNINSVEDVILAFLDEKGNLFIKSKSDNPFVTENN